MDKQHTEAGYRPAQQGTLKSCYFCYHRSREMYSPKKGTYSCSKLVSAGSTQPVEAGATCNQFAIGEDQ